MTDRSSWLATRRLGIGGSDIASVFNIGYGCRRRLWYDKRDTPEDFPREENKAMALGNVLEPFFAAEYAKTTGRVIAIHDEPFVHPEIPELRVNVDRTVYLDTANSRMGVLEVKAQGRGNFFKTKREGLAEDYILQLQHGMLVTGAKWGSFAIGNRDSGDLLSWDVEADPKIQEQIKTEGPKFWSLVENGPIPDALEPDDARCQKCEYRRTCQGNALIAKDESGEMPQMEILRPLLAEYDERKEMFAAAEDAFEAVKEEVKSELGDKQAVMVGERKVYFRPQEGRVTWQGKELAAAVEAFVGHIITELANGTLTIDDVVNRAPSREKFIKQGNPFKTLRIY